MAPEQWIDAQTRRARADLYALGVLAYEALTGARPFAAATLDEIARTARRRRGPAARPRPSPPALDAFFARALAKRPEDRPPTRSQLAAAFRRRGRARGRSRRPAATRRSRARRVARRGAAADRGGGRRARGARNAHQARDAARDLVRVRVLRYLAALALAARAQVGRRDDPASPTLLRTLRQRELADDEWLRARIARSSRSSSARGAYPVPELVELRRPRDAFTDGALRSSPRAMRADSEACVVEHSRGSFRRSPTLLRAARFVLDYPLVVAATGHGERWMGVRRTQRPHAAVARGRRRRRARCSIDATARRAWSLCAARAAARADAGPPLELFVFEGRGRRGARLVARPPGSSITTTTLWDWLARPRHRRRAIVEREAPRATIARRIAGSRRSPPTTRIASSAASARSTRSSIACASQRCWSSSGRRAPARARSCRPACRAAASWRTVARPGRRRSPRSRALAAAARRASSCATAIRDAVAAVARAPGRHRRDRRSARGAVHAVCPIRTSASGSRPRSPRRGAARRRRASRVICTLRDDFLMRVDELAAAARAARAVAGPARRPGPRTISCARSSSRSPRRLRAVRRRRSPNEMVDEVADRPGALALLSFTASSLWELRDRAVSPAHAQGVRRDRRRRRRARAARRGHARSDRPTSSALVREVFRHLVTAEGTRAVLTTRRARANGSRRHARIASSRSSSRRACSRSPTATAMRDRDRPRGADRRRGRGWSAWRREDPEGARLRDQLRAAAKQWHERARARGLLWRGDLARRARALAEARGRDADRGRDAVR